MRVITAAKDKLMVGTDEYHQVKMVAKRTYYLTLPSQWLWLNCPILSWMCICIDCSKGISWHL